jgi:hypothetical protein
VVELSAKRRSRRGELERGAASNGSAERHEIIKFIDQVRANEACSGMAFAKWTAACKTDCIRGGLGMIAERESYHARVFEQRLRDLGVEPKAKEFAGVAEFHEYFPEKSLSDPAKLIRLTAGFPVPKEAVNFIFDFAAGIKDDLQTKDMIKLFAQDELSSATWLFEFCNALNAAAERSERSMMSASVSD